MKSNSFIALATSFLLASSTLMNAAEIVHTRVIPGTYTWNVASDKLGARKADFHWNQISPEKREFAPQKGTTAGLVETPFDEVTLATAKGTTLSPQPLAGQQLRPGRVIVFKTGAGRYGKLQVVRYTPLQRGNKVAEEYNIEVRWVLF